MKNSDYESIKGIFEIFDKDQHGYLNVKELSSLHESLGEPLTFEEADLVMNELDKNSTGKVYLDEFVIWWINSHQEGNTEKLTQKFKMEGSKIINNNEFEIKNIFTQSEEELGTIKYRLHFFYKDPKTKKK